MYVAWPGIRWPFPNLFPWPPQYVIYGGSNLGPLGKYHNALQLCHFNCIYCKLTLFSSFENERHVVVSAIITYPDDKNPLFRLNIYNLRCLLTIIVSRGKWIKKICELIIREMVFIWFILCRLIVMSWSLWVFEQITIPSHLSKIKKNTNNSSHKISNSFIVTQLSDL